MILAGARIMHLRWYEVGCGLIQHNSLACYKLLMERVLLERWREYLGLGISQLGCTICQNWYVEADGIPLYGTILYDEGWVHFGRVFFLHWKGWIGVALHCCFTFEGEGETYEQLLLMGGWRPWLQWYLCEALFATLRMTRNEQNTGAQCNVLSCYKLLFGWG